jgi:phytoene dehydrogenase-like protein
MDESPNPLKNIFQIIEEEPEWITYDRWGTVLPNGAKFAGQNRTGGIWSDLREHGGPGAEQEFAAIMKRMAPLSNAAQALTSLALREDAGAVFTLLRYPKELFDTLQQGKALNEPFSEIMKEMNLSNKFVINWLDMLCFLLQGLPASGTMNCHGLHVGRLVQTRRDVRFSEGRLGGIVDALVRGVTKHGSKVCVNCHVEEILIKEGKASGVKLADGRQINESKLLCQMQILT